MAWPTAPGQIAAPLAGFCWRRHLELAHVKCSHPPQSLWPDLEMCCARGADTSSQGEKKDTKRATSCEVALSKRLVELGGFEPPSKITTSSVLHA